MLSIGGASLFVGILTLRFMSNVGRKYEIDCKARILEKERFAEEY
jgi:hypothetical protein